LSHFRASRRPRARLLSSGELARLVGVSKRSIVKAVAEGRIRAARTVGGHYRIALPEARKFMSGRGMDTAELEARENCVLVLARDRFLGDLLADVLGRTGSEVVHCDDLFGAGVVAARSRPWLLIVDAAAAGPDPAAVCRGLAGSDACRQSSILFLAGPDPEERGRLSRAGAHAVLGKPFSVKQLKDALRDLGFSTGSFRRIEA